MKQPSKQIFAQSWDFVPNGLTPSRPRTLRFPKRKKKCLFCILGYSKHIIFSWKSPIFLVIGDFYVIFGNFWWHFWWFFCWDLGTPAILRQNPNKLSFGQFWKKVGIGSDPRPPPWAKFPTFTENLFWELPLYAWEDRSENQWENFPKIVLPQWEQITSDGRLAWETIICQPPLKTWPTQVKVLHKVQLLFFGNFSRSVFNYWTCV